MVDCSYKYRGKTYSTDRILRTLVRELPSRSQQESIDFLKEQLDMSEDEIVVVKGLIEGKALGRFKADGKILLSDLATPDVAYHEAFHRVWRLFLSPEERLQAIKEIKSRKNIQNLMNAYREVYPKLSDNDLMEEILADEFADYTLNKNYKVELPIKSIFRRLWNFIKKMLGLKPQQTQMLYDKILQGKFKNNPKSVQQYLKDADKLIIQDEEFTVEQKNEVIQLLTQRFVKAMLSINGDIEMFLSKPSVKIQSLVQEVIVPDLLKEILATSGNEDLVNAIYSDVEDWNEGLFIPAMIRNLKLLGLNLKEDPEDTTEGSLDDDTQVSKEFQASIEVDPKSKMGTKVKLLLSSLVDNSDTTPAFGLPKPLSWTKGFLQIATRMAGIPTSVFREELRNTNLPYVQDLITLLDKDPNFGNKFISTMAMTENKFLKMEYKDGDIYFYNANSGTKKDKIVGEWRNKLLRRISNFEQWKEDVRLAKDDLANVDTEDLMNLLGIDANENIPNLRAHLQVMLNKVAKYDGEKPTGEKLFKSLDIKGFIDNLAGEQSMFEDAQDLMVSLNGTKLYTLGQNTQQTTVINGVKYAQTKFTPEMSVQEKIDILKQFAKFQVSEFNLTQNEDGTVTINNKWLEKILNGEQLDLVIPYQVETEEGNAVEVSQMDEADLMTMHINGALQGVNMSMKHGDRSTFFAYTFGNTPLYSNGTVSESLQNLTNNIVEQIYLEAKLFRKMEQRNLPVQYIGKNYKNLGFASIIGEEEFKKVVAGSEVESVDKITEFVNQQFDKFKADVKRLGLLEQYEVPVYKDGKKTHNLKRYKGINNSIISEIRSEDVTLANAFTNEVSNHIFETRFFSGDVRAFKDGADLFKRLVPQSSTGNLTVTDQVTKDLVRQKLDQTFQILNPKTGKMEDVNPSLKIKDKQDDYFRAVTGFERKNYKSHLLELATFNGEPLISKLTGKQESKLFMMFEFGFMKDFPEMNIDELKKIYLPKFELYSEKYNEINENDGLSYMTLPAFKNFMLRQGNWSDAMEVVYQAEMQIASLSNPADIANVEVTVNGHTFKPFEIKSQNIKDKDGNVIKSVDGWKERVVGNKIVKTEAVHTLKTQFAGYSTPEEYFEETAGEMEYLFNSVFKTSQHLLLPSAIMGTNLQLMNFSMLSNGLDIYHMGSANKVGGVDPKLAIQNILNNEEDERNNRKHLQDIKERGLDFYDKDGYFNHEALTENLDVLTYLSDWTFLKDQVNIGNKVKDEIKGSTQSLKILLSNLIVNGQPRFEGAQELVDKYKQVIRDMVKTNHDSLLERIGFNIDTNGFDSLDQLKKAVLGSKQMQSAPDNIRNSVENFFSDTNLGLESMPMKNKIENVLYSLITNGIISFDRPGTSYPQAAITGYEKLGSRKFDENGVQQSNQDTLKFYNPIFDKDGNVVEIEPSEIIIPLPDFWIKPLLKWAKTNNLVEAIDKLNNEIGLRPELFQFKGLRIPNQQLSSNDFFQVKKFNLPTMQNYVLVPSEIVVKVGSD